MKKRLLALLCMVVMVVGVFAVAATNANATGSEVTYEVGYAKVSISPWANPSAVEGDADYLTLLSGIKFAGYGSAEDRYTDTLGIIDDNGDDKTDRNDGLYATCTVVTEFVGGTEGKTLVFFTMDTLNGYDHITTDMRSYVPTLLSDANVVANQIMVSGSHNHTGPMVNDLRKAYKTEFDAAVTAAKEAGTTEPTYLDFVPDDNNQSIYYKYILDQMLSAARTAYNDKEAATISTKSVDASDVMGVKMNYIRHYSTEYSVGFSGDPDYYASGTAIMGSNFGFTNGHSFGSTWGMNIKGYITSQDHIADADDTLQLVKFDVADSKGKDDIVFVTWQAHPDNASYAGLSSDYIGGLRYRMENNKALTGDNSKENYRVAFFQGAAGNLVAASNKKTEWMADDLIATGLKNPVSGVSSNGSPKSYSFNKYGYLMGQVALSGLEGSGSWKSISGAIRNMQTKYAATPTVYNEAQINAADDYYENGGTFPYTYTHTYTDGTKETVVLNSIHHANHINTIKNSREGQVINMELNAIMLGDGANSLAFVTAPGEMFDRYNNEDVYSYDDSATSGWGSIANASTYGTPIIMGYSNAATGYVPNRAAFHYNEKQGQTGVPASEYLGIGSYEANTSNYVEGTGEAVMAEYKTMLTQTAGEQRYCEHCKDTVEFAPLAQGGVGSSMVSGHYYLTEDITNSTNVTIDSNTTVCLDLNGFTWSNTYGNNVFYVGTKEDPTGVLNIMDSSKGAGTIQTKARALIVYGTVNLYSGTIDATGTEAVANGETIYITGGTVNQHGGSIHGGKTTTYGGAIRFWLGTFNMYDGYVYGDTALNGAAIANLAGTVNLEGGEITSGTLLNEGVGECVYVSAHSDAVLKIADDAKVEDIYVTKLSAVNIQLTDNFNGKIDSITFADVELEEGTNLGTRIGNAQINASIPVTGTNPGTFYLGVLEDNLIATANDPNTVTAWIGDTTYETMDAAIAAYDEGKIIKLNKDITYTFTETVYLDLNGHDANVTGSTGTVYVLDSATDDYKGSYGSVTGTVQPATDTNVIPGKDWYSAYSAYVAVEEDDGSKSYHRLDLGIKDTVVQTGTEDLGIYYDFGLYADETLKDKITSYGVAVSTKGDPVENGALKEGQDYHKTELNTFAAGSDGNIGKSSSITNIMKQSYGYAANKRNAASTIYGTAYMVLDGNYVFAPCAENSLKSTVQAINNKWTDLTEVTQTPVLDYYKTYKSIMKPWSLGNITAAAEAAEAEEEETLKILTVGNSHSVDAMYMLYEVYQQMNPEKEIELGILYYSGCPVERHLQFIQENTPAYVYYKINKEIYESTGKWQLNDNSTFNTALKDEQWDYIILQEMSNYIAQKTMASATNGKLDWLIQYVKTNAKAVPKLGFHMVWAMPMDDAAVNTYAEATRGQLITNLDNWFGNKDGKLNETDAERLVMQRRAHQRIIDNTTKYIETNTAFDFVINTGSAVNHALNAFGVAEDLAAANHKVYRDYTHLSNWSRLMAAYVWYAELETAEGRTVESVSAEDIIATVPSGFFIADRYGITGETLTDGKFVVDNQDKMVAAINYALETPYNLLFDRVAEN